MGRGTEDLTGRRFGRLRVLERLDNKKHSGNARWLCGCDCGRSVSPTAGNLRAGRTQSCGCLNRELASARKKASKVPGKLEFGHYSHNAKTRGLSWELTLDQFACLRNAPCTYCGNPGPGGVDRVDNALGYLPGNVAPCCRICNFMKNTLEVDTFIQKARQIAEHSKNGTPKEDPNPRRPRNDPRISFC